MKQKSSSTKPMAIKKAVSKAAPTSAMKPRTAASPTKKVAAKPKTTSAKRKVPKLKVAAKKIASPMDPDYERPWASRVEKAAVIAAWKKRRDMGKSVASGLFEPSPAGMHALELTDLMAEHIKKVERAMDSSGPVPGLVGRRIDELAKDVAEQWITMVVESLTETEELGERAYSERSPRDVAAWIRLRQRAAPR